MASHKFLTNKEGGYFYRFYPNIIRFRETPRDPLKRLLLFADPPQPPQISINTHSLYGKFLDKYNDKGLTIELEMCGEIIFNDKYTGASEQRELTSILIIQVTDEVYKHQFEIGKIYFITTTSVKELNCVP